MKLMELLNEEVRKLTPIEYKNALVEALEVIKFMPKEERELIPSSIIEKMQNEKSKNYYFSLDRTQKFSIQISKEAKAILANLFKEYWATSDELGVIKAIELKNRMMLEKYKLKKYPIENIFKKDRRIV